MQQPHSAPERERGFALILAIMTLVLLTFLGLTLATTTSTELQIATNYRWSQQALYNAEAGIEAGKRILAAANWALLLPPPRVGTTWDITVTPADTARPAYAGNSDAWGNGTRNFENGQCDRRGNSVGYGVVLDAIGFGMANVPFPVQNVSTIWNVQLDGAFTVWIRRVTDVNVDGTFQDSIDNDELILTAEGVAPFTGNAASEPVARIHAARRVMEVLLTKAPGGCATQRRGQVGGGPEGAGFGGCVPVTEEGLGTEDTSVQ